MLKSLWGTGLFLNTNFLKLEIYKIISKTDFGMRCSVKIQSLRPFYTCTILGFHARGASNDKKTWATIRNR